VIRLNGSDTYFCHLDNRPVKWINKFHEKRALQKADALLSVSQFTAELTNKIFGLNREFVIIPNAIDTVLFTNKESNYASITESKLGLEPNLRENTILYFGSLIRKKGVLELPFIFNQLIKIVPDAKLILVGKDVPDIISGNTSTWLMMQSLFTTAALKNVTYSGSVSYIEIQNKIKLATVCVFPSFAEALPVSWLEAMAMQKAIVTSNIGWAKEIIEDGKEGFLADPKKHFDFAMKISALLNNTILTIDFGKAAREKAVAKFDICVISYKNIEFYKSVFKVEK
jgi:glycosyltransferase involved in cell wall biosynthesis